VCVHQDVYLPEGWDRCLAQQLREAERTSASSVEPRFGPIGVAGVYGVGPVLSAEGGPATCSAAEAAKGGARCDDFIPHPSSFIPLPPSLIPAEAAERIGWVVGRGRMLRDGPDLPARVATLDELLLVLPREFIAVDSVERALRLLEKHDPSLRAVATMATDGFTREEIAGRLGQSLSAIEQKVRAIRAILGPVFGRMNGRAV
jgi:hypothetical protein